MTEVQAENLRALGGILRQKNEEILRLREENAELRGQLTEAQKQMDAEDEMVFRLLKEKPELSVGEIHVILR